MGERERRGGEERVGSVGEGVAKQEAAERESAPLIVCHALARGEEQNGENSHKEGSSWEKEVRNQVSTSLACIPRVSSVCAIAIKRFNI